MLLAHAVERLLDFLVGDGDLRIVGAQFLVAFDLDLGHHLEAGLEAQRLAVVNVQVGDPRLRDRNQSQLLRLFAEVARHQSLNHIALEVFLEALPDDGSGHVPGAESRQPRHLLILLDDDFSFASNFLGRDLDRNLALDAVFVLLRHSTCFCGTHVYPFSVP